MRRVYFAKNAVYYHPLDKVMDRIPLPERLSLTNIYADHAYIFHTLRRTVWVMLK